MAHLSGVVRGHSMSAMGMLLFGEKKLVNSRAKGMRVICIEKVNI